MKNTLYTSKLCCNVDRIGAFASTLCAIHCVICAFLPLAFAFLGLDILMDHNFEWGLTLFALVFAVFALYLGWQTHRTPYILTLLLVGITGLFIARGLEGEHGHSEEVIPSASAVESQTHHGRDQHHGEHKGEHHGEHKGEHKGEHHGEHKGEHHGEHHGDSHLYIEGLAIFSSLCLMIGHLLNLIGIRRAQKLDSTHVCTTIS